MSFESNIQTWVSVDNQIKILNQKLNELREKRSSLGEEITKYAEKNNLSNATIQISDGNLKFANTRVIAPLTFKYLEKSLGEIIKSESQSKQIIDYLKQHREVKQIQEIKRITKN